VGLKAPGAEIIASITLIAIVTTILIQATTTQWLARRLGLLVEKKEAPPAPMANSEILTDYP
jgi:potassium/hydrogen antiporter